MTDYKIGDKVPLATPVKTRAMRDVMPNGDDFRSKNFRAHRTNDRDRDINGDVRPPAGNMSEFGIILGLKLACPECDAQANEPCISIAKISRGEPMKTIHGKRFQQGRTTFYKVKKRIV